MSVMELQEKLRILAGAAKYDVSCSSSGSSRPNTGGIGNAQPSGICHAWTADGRCVSLLKVLYTNQCAFDCAYCACRRSNEGERAAFSPDELARLTMAFYRRNYIEGLFLSSAVAINPDRTMERLIRVAEILRFREGFQGYIHMKAIPGADLALVRRLGFLVDRMSINIEFPTPQQLALMAPDKQADNIRGTMLSVRDTMMEYANLPAVRMQQPFVPAGQSTQMIVGAGDETDHDILQSAQSLYRDMRMKRVFYSAYVPVNRPHPLAPVPAVPLKREHRIYQADWLLRFYGFDAQELLAPGQNLDLALEPKAAWALRNPALFPVDINRAPYEMLLRVPGIGVKSAQRIVASRRMAHLTYDGLRKIGVVMKRAAHFVVAEGRRDVPMQDRPDKLYNLLCDVPDGRGRQLSFFDTYDLRV